MHSNDSSEDFYNDLQKRLSQLQPDSPPSERLPVLIDQINFKSFCTHTLNNSKSAIIEGYFQDSGLPFKRCSLCTKSFMPIQLKPLSPIKQYAHTI